MKDIVTIAALAFGLLGFVAGWMALQTLGKLRRSVALLSRGASGQENILDVTEKHIAASEAVRKDVLDLQRDMVTAQSELEKGLVQSNADFQKNLAKSHAEMATTLAADRANIAKTVNHISESVGTMLRRVALVRYDAFDDLGGRLSFSLAIMDDNGDGIALTSIASPTETRLYAKSLAKGVGEHALSPEEQQAVKAAMSR